MPPTAGPATTRELEADRALRERAHEDLLRHERGHQRAAGGRPDRTPDPLDEREREERPDLVGAADRDPEQPNEDGDVERDHEREEPPPREPVGEVPRGEREQRQREELGERDERRGRAGSPATEYTCQPMATVAIDSANASVICAAK